MRAVGRGRFVPQVPRPDRAQGEIASAVRAGVPWKCGRAVHAPGAFEGADVDLMVVDGKRATATLAVAAILQHEILNPFAPGGFQIRER